jgi:TrmH family RNA methyltransferase
MNLERKGVRDLSLSTRVDVILVEPGEGGNVGRCARGCKNMGISSLRLVRPAFSDWPEAKKMAVHAIDVLEAARVYPSLEEAIAEDTWVVGCTARERDNPERKMSLSPGEFTQILSRRSENGRVAVVFGSERTGLTNADLGLCQDVIKIPAHPDYPVLNLSHAVLLVAWEIRRADLEPSAAPSEAREVVSSREIDGLVSHMQRTLTLLKYLNPQNPRIVLDELRGVFSRAQLTPRELQMLRGIFHRMDVTISEHGGLTLPVDRDAG